MMTPEDRIAALEERMTAAEAYSNAVAWQVNRLASLLEKTVDKLARIYTALKMFADG